MQIQQFMSGIPIWTFKQTSQLLSHTSIFKQSTCYTVTPDTHQLYRINNNQITDKHNIAIYNDTTVNMVPLQPTESLEFNAFEAIVRLLHSQNQRHLPNDIQTQTAPNTSVITNSNIGNTPKTNITQPHDQSIIILKQFNMITKELKISQIKCLVILQRLHRLIMQHKKTQANL